jgi:hypothetical protein
MRKTLTGVQRDDVLADQARLLAVGGGQQQRIIEQDEANNCSASADLGLEKSPTWSHYAALGRWDWRNVFQRGDRLVAVLQAALYP